MEHEPLTLIRAAESSAVFRDLFDDLCIFPLRGIVQPSDGPAACTCTLGPSCQNIGKHPAIRWRELTAGEKVRSADPNAGYGIATGHRSGVFVVDIDSAEAP
jgi:hypothetical protein